MEELKLGLDLCDGYTRLSCWGQEKTWTMPTVACRKKVDLRNEADSMVYQTEKSLNEFGDKVTADEKGQVQPKIDALKEALKGTDIEKIKSAKEELQTAFYAVAERVYKEQGAAGAAGAEVSGEGTSSAASGGDNVVDVDYKDAD